MADTKISALTASTTPLAGTEVLPIVQGGVTKQVSVANLTAGRAISATQVTLTTGSLIVASGQGIDFSATPGTGTSELFNDYEEGTWTPSAAGDAGITGTWTVSSATYTKIGRMVFCTVSFTGSGIGFSSPNGYYAWSGLPFSAAGGINGTWSSDVVYVPVTGHVAGAGATAIYIYATQSTVGAGSISATFSYFV